MAQYLFPVVFVFLIICLVALLVGNKIDAHPMPYARFDARHLLLKSLPPLPEIFHGIKRRQFANFTQGARIHHYSHNHSKNSSQRVSSAPSLPVLADMALSEKQKRVDRWRRGMGLCCICGQPLAAPLQPIPAAFNTDDADYHYNNSNAALLIEGDGRILTEECPVKMSLIRFNMLGDHHDAHILDDYTFLEGRRNNVSFWQEFETHQEEIKKLCPEVFESFEAQVHGKVYDTAVATMKRTVASLTVCACQRCNKAMTRTSEHTMAVFRCYSLTEDCDSPFLETKTLSAGAARKMLQQIALYFDYESKTKQWASKKSDHILKDAALWRCVAYLHCWGTAPAGAGVRFLLIAIFHAAHYIYLTGSTFVSGSLSFEAWHVYVWRDLYLSRYEPSTFFGMHQAEAGGIFNIFQKKEGASWVRYLMKKLRAIAQKGPLMVVEMKIDLDNLKLQMQTASKTVQNERTMLHFACTKHRDDFLRNSKSRLEAVPPIHSLSSPLEAGVKSWLSFFRYNFSLDLPSASTTTSRSSPSTALLSQTAAKSNMTPSEAQFSRFLAELVKSYAAWQRQSRNPSSEASFYLA